MAKKKQSKKKKTVRTEVKRTRTVTRELRNPASADAAVREAVQRFTGFKGERPQSVKRVRVADLPKVMLTIGDCIGIMYRTHRGGRTDSYLHRFKKSSRPTLCCSSDGKTLYLLGGAYRVTNRGIEDAR
jgi:hypothetical protein